MANLKNRESALRLSADQALVFAKWCYDQELIPGMEDLKRWILETIVASKEDRRVEA